MGKRKQGTKLIFSSKFVLSRVSPPDLDFPYLHLTLISARILSLNQSLVRTRSCNSSALKFDTQFPETVPNFSLKNTLKFGIKQGIY
jgi:hypothetical protein